MADNFWRRNLFDFGRNLLSCLGSWKFDRILAIHVSDDKVLYNGTVHEGSAMHGS